MSITLPRANRKALQTSNFIDTAEMYETYEHIREAIRISGKHPVVATKSYAYSKEGARASLEKARKELDLDVIDIFLLHEQESEHTLRGHR
jgi:diketogulonate reductase-like aldo/keto reductase